MPSPALAQPRREHLIEVARTLFNAHGYHQVGIDLIMRESGVSKTTLYKYFASKDALVLEVLKRRSAQTLLAMHTALNRLAPDAGPEERIDTIFGVIEAWIQGDAFFGCGFARAAAEYGVAGNPVREQAQHHKRALRTLIADQLRSRPQPDRLADQIMLVLEGAIATAQIDYQSAPMVEARALIAGILRSKAREAASC